MPSSRHVADDADRDLAAVGDQDLGRQRHEQPFPVGGRRILRAMPEPATSRRARPGGLPGGLPGGSPGGPGTPGDWEIHRFGSIDSTNRYLLDAARAGAADGLVAVADHQTAGRGRLGREWSRRARIVAPGLGAAAPGGAVRAARRAPDGGGPGDGRRAAGDGRDRRRMQVAERHRGATTASWPACSRRPTSKAATCARS